MFVRLSDGALRNAYTRAHHQQDARDRASFALVDRPASPARSRCGRQHARPDGRFVVEVGPDQTREVRVLVTDYADAAAGASIPITFRIYRSSTTGGERARRRPFPRALSSERCTTRRLGQRRRTRGPRQLTGRMVLVLPDRASSRVVVGVNAIMIRAAISTFGGVETASSYQAGLAFKREIAAAEAQDALHWQVQAKRRARPTVRRWSRSIARDAAGQPLAGLAATARLAHPTDRRADLTVALGENAAGHVSRRRPTAVAGQWDLVIELSRDGERLFRSQQPRRPDAESACRWPRRSISRCSCSARRRHRAHATSRSRASAAPAASARSRAA